MQQQQEVEVKIQLLSKEDYDKFDKEIGTPKVVQNQENVFFDGTQKEITSVKSIFRLRFFDDENKKERCFLTHKGKSTLSQGVSSVEESEEEVDAQLARQAISDPNTMLQWKGELIELLRDMYKVNGFVYLGGFKTLRKKYEFENHLIEFDQVQYSFGTNYEIEVETPDAHSFKPKLTQLLDNFNVKYQDSKRSKFANFVAGSIAY
jgi:uncharacterized protein YjbK